tara:strand:+ start:28566 stop:29258 length:693 start_codon:yes stop_codon:yes gene_type:complete
MKKEKIISLSHWIDEKTPSYGNKGGFLRKSISSISKGRNSNSEYWEFNNHIGTHIDFPMHFDDSGKSSSDYEYPFFIFNKIGIIHCDKLVSPNQFINYDLLKGKLEKLNVDTQIILIKTGFEKFRDSNVYWENNPVFDSNIPINLKTKFKNLQIIGFDSISLTSLNDKDMGKKAHLEFLKVKPPVLIIEDMKLSVLEKGDIPLEIHVFPLMIKSSDGSPVNCSLKIKHEK